MQITLKCKYTSGSVAFPKERIEGLPVDARRYDIAGGMVVIAGDDTIVHHDVDVLLNMPDKLYRMLIPAEQEALAKQAQQASTTQENAPSDTSTDNPGQSDPAPTDPDPDSPPAQQKQKKE